MWQGRLLVLFSFLSMGIIGLSEIKIEGQIRELWVCVCSGSKIQILEAAFISPEHSSARVDLWDLMENSRFPSGKSVFTKITTHPLTYPSTYQSIHPFIRPFIMGHQRIHSIHSFIIHVITHPSIHPSILSLIHPPLHTSSLHSSKSSCCLFILFNPHQSTSHPPTPSSIHFIHSFLNP